MAVAHASAAAVAGQRVFAKDSENKEFLLTVLKLAGAGVLGALALAVVLVGGKSAIENAKI